jgi:hypothetical protein
MNDPDKTWSMTDNPAVAAPQPARRSMNATALQAYIYHMNRADELLTRLCEFVDDMGNVQPEDVNWTHTGDAARLADDLTAIVAYTFDKE